MLIVRKIKLTSFFNIIFASIIDGKKNYLVLFVGAAIATVISGALSQSGDQGILGSLFNTLWLAGAVLVSQAIFKKQNPPSISQFFLSFTNASILKKMIPAICAALACGLVVLVVMTPLIGLMTIFMRPNITSEEMQIQMIGFTVGINVILFLCSLFLTIPLTFFTILNLLKKISWQLAFKMSYRACIKNLGLFALIALTCSLPIMIFSSLPLLSFIPSANSMFAWLGGGFGDSMEKTIATLVSGLIKLVFTIVTPFLMTFFYRLYREIFISDQPDIDLDVLLNFK